VAERQNNTSISAIIITHNSSVHILSCLKVLSAELIKYESEMILFDNYSIDTTISSARTAYPSIKIIKSDKNIGFGAANNQAVLQAQGKYILLVNPDLILDNGSIAVLLDVLENRSNAGAVVPRLRNSDESFQPTCRQFPRINNIIFSRGSILSKLDMRHDHDRYTLGDLDKITEVPAVAATCMLIERAFFLKLGGFDTRFFLFMEDTDLSVRIGQMGKKIYFVPQAGGVHFWGEGTSISMEKRRLLHHISVWKYFLKYFPNGFSVFILPIMLAINYIFGLIINKKQK
jgi:GT2 family glycosyltransferase